MSVEHECGVSVSGGSAQGGYDPEKVGWETVESVPEDGAYMMWHEVTHNYGYMGPWSNENGDEFGMALAAGDIDSDGLDELVVGAPGENSQNGYIFVAEKISGTWM